MASYQFSHGSADDGVIRDRRKLTFYFIAEKRIDFRELVRELFWCGIAVLYMCVRHSSYSSRRLYETRIWMTSPQHPGGYEH